MYMMEKWDNNDIMHRLKQLLSSWDIGELSAVEEAELSGIVDGLKENEVGEACLATLNKEAKDSLSLYISLQELSLTEDESANLDSFVSSLAVDEEKPKSVRKWRKVSWDRIYLIVSAACVLLLFGMFMFIDASFDDKRESEALAQHSVHKIADTVQYQVPVSDMMAMNAVNQPAVNAESGNASNSESGSSAVSNSNSQSEQRNVYAKSKKRVKNSTETEWEICKRLLKEMNLNSESISNESIVIVNENFDVDLSSKVIVTDMLRDMASRIIL